MQKFMTSVSSIGLIILSCSGFAAAAQTTGRAPAAEADDNGGIPEITVTARRRAESLQKVPDAITAFTSQAIINANIQNIGDLARVTPALNFRDGAAFAGNFFDVRLRGIGTAQQGWPSVSLIVDGVPNDSPDVLTAGSLNDVERIEVLRGPQSALYGSGAIAGAINVVTKRPSNEFHAEGRLYYGNGQDAQASASVSGALVDDKLLARLAVNFRDDNGRIDSATNGLHLAPHNRKAIEGRLIFLPTETLEIDLRGTYNKEENGFGYQGRTDPTPDFANAPQYFARAVAGMQDRLFKRITGRVNLDLGGAAVTSVTSYGRTKQSGFGSGCYDDVNNPNPAWRQADGAILCLLSTRAYGNRATPGQVQDIFQTADDNYRTFFQDLRLSSDAEGPIQWLFGASYMRRRADNGFTAYNVVAGAAATTTRAARVDRKLDRWWGAYGQVSATLGQFELTLNARYDDQDYYNSAFNLITGVPVPIVVTSPTGAPIVRQHESKRAFQPKGQVSYRVNEDAMLYATVSRGFRAGFFSSANFAAPERTTNYEGGIKSSWLDRKLIVNASAFHIDYSNQQTSTTLNTPPFRLPVTIPSTKIDGAELESTVQIASTFSVSGNVSYLRAKVSNGTVSPKAPKWSGSISGQLLQPLTDAWTLNANASLSFHSSQYLFINNTQQIDGNSFLNARIGLERDGWGVYLVGTNLTKTVEDQMQSGTTTPYRVLYPVEPRSYGIEVRVRY